jgi:hypothetical protein
MNYFNLPIASLLALSLGMFLGSASPAQAAVDIAISPPYLEFEVAPYQVIQFTELFR